MLLQLCLLSIMISQASGSFKVLNEDKEFRVMTFNIWLSGLSVQNGVYKIAKHIRLNDPDIVAIQELENTKIFSELQALLNDRYMGITHNDTGYPDTAILTKHKINYKETAFFETGVGAEIKLENGLKVRFVCVHLDYKSYGPYAAFNKLVTNVSQILAGETTRQKNMNDIVKRDIFQRWEMESSHYPLLLAGDFNCPSDLDWGKDQKDIHGGWAVEWPATKILSDEGFVDSYRKFHPNVTTHPGNSWSTVNKSPSEWGYTIPEPQSRIDFIFYKSTTISVNNAYMYAGTEPLVPMPNHYHNDYPSDHYAMISDFKIDV